MRFAIIGVILITLLVHSTIAAQERRTAIIGWPPYSLGADLVSIRAANSELTQCPPDVSRKLPRDWSCLQGTVLAPIRGTGGPLPVGADRYTATLLLFFERGILKSVTLIWAFADGVERRLAATALEREVLAAYASELKKQRVDQGYAEWATVLQDASGNVLIVGESRQSGAAFLWYVVGDAREIAPPPMPPARY